MLNKHVTSKAEIAKELNLSMPTVLANVNDLLEKMVLEETGEYASTGGRKAKSIGINKSYLPVLLPKPQIPLRHAPVQSKVLSPQGFLHPQPGAADPPPYR